MKTTESLRVLHASRRNIFTLGDLKKLLAIHLDNTAYKTAETLVRNKILIRLGKGVYGNTFSPPEDFEIANTLYAPSYVSLESALSFYGILPQFPYGITSVSPRRTHHAKAAGKDFEYIHIQRGLFCDYVKEKTFLVAEPEKALVDCLYLVSKGCRKLDFDALDCTRLNKKRFREMADRITILPFQRLRRSLNL